MKKPSCSLIVSTYNWPQALSKSLQSALQQTVLPDEIVIADDGSAGETRVLIAATSRTSKIPIQHIWQEDEGFRLAKIRNKAFVAASCDYIIQVDGDQILHPNFIEDHLHFCRVNTFIGGTRCLLHEDITREILASEGLPALPIKTRRMDKKYNSIRNRMLSHLMFVLPGGRKDPHYVIGGNMAFWKKDLVSVNGYNEAYKGWGKEDNDLAIRLRNAGVVLRFIKFGAIAYHLEHVRAEFGLLSRNEAMLAEASANKVVRIEKGMDNN